MANTTTLGSGTIEITGLDADWILSTATGFKNLRVSSIQFNPSAANDIMIVHDGGIDGASLFHSGPAGGTAPIFKNFDPPRRCSPVIDITDCTFTTAANARVIIDYV